MSDTNDTFTNASASNRAREDAVDILLSLDRHLAGLPPYARRELCGILERLGASRITLTSLRQLAEDLPYPAGAE
jgi:hypothetical protein